MEEYTKLNREMERKMSLLFEDVELFFAFSNEQFKEGAKGEKHISSIGQGGFVPKKNAKEYVKRQIALNEWHRKEVQKLDSNKVIKYELNNHEVFYSGHIEGAFVVLKDYGYTRDQVMSVFKKGRSSSF